jgi:hypothetical protein
MTNGREAYSELTRLDLIELIELMQELITQAGHDKARLIRDKFELMQQLKATGNGE